MTRREEIRVPDIGDFHDVEVVDVLVAAGDTVGAEAPLISLETDKASMEVPAERAGTVVSVAVRAGERIGKGALIARLEETAGATPQLPRSAAVVREDCCRGPKEARQRAARSADR